MSSTSLTLTTPDGERIIRRLANHWRHKLTVTTENDKTTIEFSEQDLVVLSYNEYALTAILTTLDEHAQDRLQEVVLSHINRMAGAEFDGVWIQMN